LSGFNVTRFQSKLGFAVLAAALSLPLSFGAAAGLFDDDEARKDIKALRAQHAETEMRIQKLDESVKNIGILQLLNQVEQLNAELARLRGQVEVLTNQNEQLAKRQKDFYLDIDTRLRKLEGVGDAPPPAVGQPVNPPASPPGAAPGLSQSAITTGGGLANAIPVAAPATTPPSPSFGIPTQEPAIQAGPLGANNRAPAPTYTREQENKAYDVGSNLFRRNDYIGAIRAFETFSKDFPTSQLVANAQYWIGIAYFNLKDFSNARSMQEGLLRKYPESAKAPDALLAIASVQTETGDNGSARNTLEDIVARFPASEAATKARTRLAQAPRR
jgi:tol-pal system protein YbgF